MALVEETAPFLTDFGIAATVNGVAVTGVFDAEYADAFGITNGTRPVLLLPSTVAASVGHSVVVSGITYTVAEIQPDGTGLTRLMLKT